MKGSSFDREPTWTWQPVDEPLTKRERFAMGDWTETEIQQMASIVADEMNTDDIDFNDYVSVSDIQVRMKARVRLADALLQELEATE